ncbi:nucleotidyltransferase family protein [Candidatus Bathyarchaeota archaeon]|nr:nucleotidyltransferase family protein [Candidatus Bathyarchaeota archaeon]
MVEKHNEEAIGVILAGGEGKRLRPLTYYFQKCMIPIGSLQKPLLEYIVTLLRSHGIVKQRLLVGYKHEQIVNYFNHGERFGVEIEYLFDDPELGGTGGALYKALEKGAFQGSKNLLIYYGDIISDIDLSKMLQQHRASSSDATLALVKGFEVPVGVAEVEGGRIVGWVEKPRLDIYAGIGIIAIKLEVLKDLEVLAEDRKQLDIMGDLLPYMISKGRRVEAYLTDAFWYDVGSTEKYEKLDNSIVDCLLRTRPSK